MAASTMSKLPLLLLLLVAVCGASSRKVLLGNELGAAKVIGLVACDACLERNFTRNTVLLPGVTVSVTCKDGNGDPFYSALQRTDRHGRFYLDMPAQLAALEPSHIAALCSSAVVNNPVPSCSRSSSMSSSIVPYGMQNGHKVFVSGPFVYRPQQAHPSCPAAEAAAEEDSSSSVDAFASEKAGSNNNPQFTFPANQLPGAGNFKFPNLPSSPASQFPASSLFPPIPTNAPPLFPQFPPLGSGSGFGFGSGSGSGLGSGSNFPQLPPFGGSGGGGGGGFQFPFFSSPPPGSKK